MQIDSLTSSELSTLMSTQKEFCVSMFLPTFRGGEAEQNPIRLKNMIREAEEKLRNAGVRNPDSYLEPVSRLQNDSGFWEHISEGLAIFTAPDFFRSYRLPLQFKEFTNINTRFYIKPLIPLFTADEFFYILGLSQNSVRLLQGTKYSVTEMDPEELPKSLSEALRHEYQQAQLQVHSRSTTSAPGGGITPGTSRKGMYHGQGVGIDDTKDQLLRYFREIDKGLREFLSDYQSPLILAGVEYLFPIYQEASSYPNLLSKGIEGNPEGLKANELHKEAWELVEPIFLKDRENAYGRYAQMAGTGNTSAMIEEILPAARFGRVDVLFVALGAREWGRYDQEENMVTLHESEEQGGEDLLDLAAVHTISNSGTVYALEPENVPDSGPIAAIFRY